MAQGYMTLPEAAQFVGMSADDLKLMAQRNQIRSFQDRGTLRFRVQDIHELARQRGATSDLELPLADSPKTPKTPKASAGNSGRNINKPAETFDFDLGPVDDESVDLGRDYASEGPQSTKSTRSKKKSGSDSDVRLVPDTKASGSDIRLVGDGDVIALVPDAPKSKTKVSKLGPPSSASKSKSKLGPASPKPSRMGTPPPQPIDSGPRLVPMDSDSDVKILGASTDEISLDYLPSAADSDIRLERYTQKAAKNQEPSMLTEEINLDEELQKAPPPQQAKVQPKAKAKPKPQTSFASNMSPFELSENDGAATEGSSDFDIQPLQDSSDFDLVPTGEEGTLLLESGDDFSLELPSEQMSTETLALASEDDSSDFDLELAPTQDAGPRSNRGGPRTPAPVQMHGSESSEFELSLDSSEQSAEFTAADSDSEFELTLEGSETDLGDASSDSEFELTLDDSSQLVLEEDSEGNKDIFETDFEAPDLEDESGSQVVALDTDMESSDFDIALGEGDFDMGDESGSQVVALDEDDVEALEEEDEPRPKKKGKGKKGAVAVEEDASEFSDLENMDDYPPMEEEEEEREVEVREVVRERLIRPAPWGALPVVLMLPCVVVMFVVGVLGFEMVQSSTGYRPPGFLTTQLGGMFGLKMGR